MKYIFPTAMLLGGIGCIIMGPAFAGVVLCCFSAVCFSELVEKDKE